jgi:hypothetical protein
LAHVSISVADEPIEGHRHSRYHTRHHFFSSDQLGGAPWSHVIVI